MESNTNNISSACLHGSDQRQRRSETSEEVDLRRAQNALGSCRYLPVWRARLWLVTWIDRKHPWLMWSKSDFYVLILSCWSQSFILFGEDEFLVKFNESYESIQYYMRRGWVPSTVLSGITVHKTESRHLYDAYRKAKIIAIQCFHASKFLLSFVGIKCHSQVTASF